ncbi:MAG: CAP domain-containing protein, partial [Sphingomonadales bacterium]
MILRIFAAVALACLTILPAHASDAASNRRMLEAEILAEINFARQHPREYAAELRKYRGYFNGGMLDLPGNSYSIETSEGVDAVDEAIDYLEQQA